MSGLAFTVSQSKIRLDDERKVGYGLLSVILLLKLVWQGVVLQCGFVSSSGDDFLRALVAYEWTKEPFFAATDFGFASVLWLPQHFWLVGSVLRIYPDIWLVPIMVSLFFAIASLFMLYQVTSYLFEVKVALIAVILAGFLPWQIWLSVSGIETTLYHFLLLTGIYFTLRWDTGHASNYLLLAALGFLLVSMVRPEGWFYVVIFSAYMLLYLYRSWRSLNNKAIITILAACIIPVWFILGWLYFNYVTYGNLLQMIEFTRQAYQQEASQVDSPLVRLVKYPALMFIVSPLLFIGLLVGLIYAFRHRTPRVDSYLLFFLGGLVLLIVASMLGIGTNSAPQRYVVASVILGTPLVAGWLYAVTYRSRGVLFVGLAIFLFFNLTVSLVGFSDEYTDVAEVGRHLRRQWAAGILAPGDGIASEKTFRAYLNEEPLDYLQEVFLIVDHWALQVMTNRPEAFAATRWDPKPLVDSTDYPHLQAYLKEEQVKVIILETRSLIDRVPPDYNLTNVIGSYLLFTRQEQEHPVVFPLSDTQPMQQSVNLNYDDILTLVGYSIDDSILPKSITLYWALQRETKLDYQMRLQLVHTQNEATRYTTEFYPYYEVYPTSNWPPGQILAERVNFPRPLDFMPGDYWLKITVVKPGPQLANTGNSGLITQHSEEEVSLGPFTLSATKRGVFKYMLQEKRIDPQLMLRVLLAL